MTVEEFFTELNERVQPKTFKLTFSKCVRTPGKYVCPICWLGKEMGLNPENSPTNFTLIAPRLGLTEEDARQIVNAADNYVYSPEVRAKLLEACKL